jgi:hypothetical protein
MHMVFASRLVLCQGWVKEKTMRVFISACLVAVIIAVGAAAVFDRIVQEPSSTAFSTSAVRI